MDKIAEQHQALANLASYLSKERNDHLYFIDGGLTLSITNIQHNRLSLDETYQNLVGYYQECGGQLVIEDIPCDGWEVIEPTGIEFKDLAQCFS